MVTSLLAFAAVSRCVSSHEFVTLAQASQLNAPVASQSGGPMTVPQTVNRQDRMLRTPTIDGKIDPDEWDVFFDNRLRNSGPVPNLAPTNSAPVVGGPAPMPPQPTGGGNPPGTGSPTGGGTPQTTPGTPAPTTPLPGTPVPATPPAAPPQPVSPGPGPLTGTPIRRTPNPDPKAKQTPPPAPPPVAATATPAPVQVAPPIAPPVNSFGILTTYLNWEPGKIYLAATLGSGQDLVVSIDGKSDGYLVGKDNLELRITPGAANIVKARILDATNPAGPVWVDAPGYVTASQIASSTTNGITTVEICLVDPGYGIVPAKLGDTFSIRFDAVATGSPPPEPFLPRVTTPVKLVDMRSEGLPTNLKLVVPAKGRGAFPNDFATVRWQFASPMGGIKRLDISPEGWLNDFVSTVSVPTPDFDPKGNSTVEYQTKVVKSAPVGYGVLKGVLMGDGWGPATAEVSFRVEPPMDVDIPARTLKYSETPQKLKSVVQIRSNSDRRIEGHLQILPPAGWTVNSGSDRNFYIQDRKGAILAGFELLVPGGLHGSFPITLRVAAIGKITDQTYWVTIL